MDASLQRLEDAFVRVDTLLTSIDDGMRKVEIDLAEISGRLTHLPTTWAMATTMVGGQIALAGLLFAILRIAGTH